MTPWDFALLALAGHRLWVLYNTQPVFRRLRLFIGRRVHPKLGQVGEQGPCPVCTSVWAAVATLAAWWVPYAGPAALAVLALSEAFAIIDTALAAGERVGMPAGPPYHFHPGNGQPDTNLVVAER